MSELDDLRDAVRGFLAAASPSETARRIVDLGTTDTGYDDAMWRRIATELGLPGIAVPERWGGAGAGLGELCVVFEEFGAALVCAPFFETVALAIPALLNSGDSAAVERFLPSLLDGTATATLVLNGTLDSWDAATVGLTARADGDRHRISGEAPTVLAGHTADLVLVAAITASGPSLFAVPADAEGLEREALASLDRTRRVARLHFADVPARLVGPDGDAGTGLARTADAATVLLAAEQLGGAQRCLDMSVGYAKSRIQFGRAIGSFQAVKHRCADMLVLVEGVRSAVVHAAAVEPPDELAISASVAKLAASEAFLHIALDNMRIHGGIGFTWEHDAHLYVRRAKSTALMFGTADHHAERLAHLVPTP